MTTTPQVHVGGTWLTTQTAWGDLSVTSRWPYGCWEASWTVPVDRGQRISDLRVGSPVTIYYGPTPIWAGVMSEPNWDTGEMVALGLVRQGESALCLNAGITTSIPDLAVDQAYIRYAVNWVRRSSISAAPLVVGDETQALNYLNALLDAYATQAGVGWGVNARREVFTASNPASPDFCITPDSGVLGVTDQVLASAVFGRYQTSGGGFETVSVGTGSPEVAVSLIELGAMDATRATQIVTGIYNETQARTGWTNGLTLSADQITTPGGAKINLASVSAGAFGPKVMRLLGLRDQRGMASYTDIVLAETTWNVADGTVACTPVGTAARDLSSAIEAADGSQQTFTA